MSHAAALLLAILAASPAGGGEVGDARTWTADRAAQLAASHAPLARAMEAEQSAVACVIDRDDPAARARVHLIRSVYHSLTDHQRNEAAAEARTAYWQAVAAQSQLELLGRAAPLLDSLDSLAATAERLEITDGNSDELADRRLQLEQRWYQADFAQQRLRNQLAGLTGVSLAEVESVMLSEPLPTVGGPEPANRRSGPNRQPATEQQSATEQQFAGERTWDVEREIATALSSRGDLQALETLCRCTSATTLPAARDMLGVLSPALAAASAMAPVRSRLLALHAPQPSTADLAVRRAQCQQLLQSQRDQVRVEIRDAVLRIEEAEARADVARRRVELAQQVARRAERAVELEQQNPGSELTAQLETLERQSELVQQQLAVAEAIVTLRQRQGTAAHLTEP